MAVDDISREHVRGVGVGIAEDVGKADSRKGLFKAQRGGLQLDHEQVERQLRS